MKQKSSKKVSLILAYIATVLVVLVAGIYLATQTKVTHAEGKNSEELSQQIKKVLNNDSLYYSYIKGEVKETQLIAFQEIGFNKTDEKKLAYHFYIYVPEKHKLQEEQKDIEIRYFNNRIILLTGKIIERNDSDRFYLVEMTCRNSYDAKHIIEKGVEKEAREYVLGYIPWRYEGVDYSPEKVDRKYLFKGYQKGLDESSKEGSTLVGKYEGTKYVDLKVTPVCYSGGLVDYNSRYQIFSVYFGVPKNLIDMYGYLQKVKASYFETKLQDIIISPDGKIVDEINSSAKNNYKPRTSNRADAKYISNLAYGCEYWSPSFGQYYDLDGEAKKYFKELSDKAFPPIEEVSNDSYLNYSIAIKRTSPKEYKISSQTLINEKFLRNPKDMPQSSVTSEDEKGKTRSSGNYQQVFENGEAVKTESLKEKTNAFQRFWHLGFAKPDISTKVDFDKRIVKIGSDVMTSEADEKYKIDKEYLSDLRKEYLANEASMKETYLLRYAVRKVKWKELLPLYLHGFEKEKGIVIGKKTLAPKVLTNNAKSAYALELPMFLDFNIISLTLKDAHGETEVYTMSSPINHVPDLIVPADTTIHGKFQNFWGEIKKVLKIIGMVLGVMLIVTVVSVVAKVVPKGNQRVKVELPQNIPKEKRNKRIKRNKKE